MLNEANLLGWVGEVKVNTLQDGGKSVRFSLLTTERWKDRNTGEQKEKKENHNIVIFGKLVELAERIIVKRALVFIKGTIRTRKYEHNGHEKYITEIVLSGYNAMFRVAGKTVQEGSAATQQQEKPETSDEIPF